MQCERKMERQQGVRVHAASGRKLRNFSVDRDVQRLDISDKDEILVAFVAVPAHEVTCAGEVQQKEKNKGVLLLSRQVRSKLYRYPAQDVLSTGACRGSRNAQPPPRWNWHFGCRSAVGGRRRAAVAIVKSSSVLQFQSDFSIDFANFFVAAGKRVENGCEAAVLYVLGSPFRHFETRVR